MPNEKTLKTVAFVISLQSNAANKMGTTESSIAFWLMNYRLIVPRRNLMLTIIRVCLGLDVEFHTHPESNTNFSHERFKHNDGHN